MSNPTRTGALALLLVSSAISCARTSAPAALPAPTAAGAATSRTGSDATSGAASARSAPVASVASPSGPRRIPGWARVFGEGWMEGADHVVPAADGGLFVGGTLGCPDGVGRRSSNPNDERLVCDRAFVARYTRSGERTWMWMAAIGESNAQDLALADDGSLVLRGSFAGDVNFDPDGTGATLRAPWSQPFAFTTHLDANGHHLRSERGRVFPNTWITTTPDGSMLLSSDRPARVNGRSARVAVLTKVDANGRRMWARSFDTFPNALLTRAVALADGSIYVTGGYHPEAEGDGAVFFAKLDAAGAIVWSRTLETGGALVHVIATTRDGSLVLAGETGHGEVDLDPGPGVDRPAVGLGEPLFVMRVRPDGERAWGYSFLVTNRHFEGLTVGPDDAVTFFVTGSGDVDLDGGPGTDQRTFAASPVYLVRLTPDGHYGGAIAMGTQPRAGSDGYPLRGSFSASQMLFDATGALVVVGRARGTFDFRLTDSPPQHDGNPDEFDALVARIEASAFTPAALAAERAR